MGGVAKVLSPVASIAMGGNPITAFGSSLAGQVLSGGGGGSGGGKPTTGTSTRIVDPAQAGSPASYHDLNKTTGNPEWDRLHPAEKMYAHNELVNRYGTNPYIHGDENHAVNRAYIGRSPTFNEATGQYGNPVGLIGSDNDWQNQLQAKRTRSESSKTTGLLNSQSEGNK